MTKTKIQKVFASLALAWIVLANIWAPSSVFATQIGTGTVVWSWAFDSSIDWDDNFPWFATGSVSGIKIKARVLPTLNMAISVAEIDLGVLVPWVASTGSLNLEVWTNAKSGVSITARSTWGWLVNTASWAIVINSDGTDGVTGESYTYASTPNGTDDSPSAWFVATWLVVAADVDDNTTEHVIYTTNKSEATNLVDDVEFVVSATAVINTPAWEYEDTVTFTVVGNF